MPLNYQLIAGPAVEPVNLALAKQQCRVDSDSDDEDDLLAVYIAGARQLIEKTTQRAIFNQTWKRTLDNFPIWWSADGTTNPSQRNNWPYYSNFWSRITIDLPMPRTVSVTSITYRDMAGTVQTLDRAAYVVDVTSEPARIVPAYGTYWPSALTYIPGSVVITFIAGTYGDGTTVNNCPFTIIQAMLLLIAHWYRNREAADQAMHSIPNGFESLIQTEKVEVLNYRPL